MPTRLVDALAAAGLALGAGLGGAGLLVDAPSLVPVGGLLATAASAVVAARLWRWSQRVAAAPHRMRDWELRPEYLVAFFATAFVMAALSLDAGRADMAAWTMPAALALLALWMVRAGAAELLFPTRTPRRPR